jgi:hypothetical protein
MKKAHAGDEDMRIRDLFEGHHIELMPIGGKWGVCIAHGNSAVTLQLLDDLPAALREAQEMAETLVDETELTAEMGLVDDIGQRIRELLTNQPGGAAEQLLDTDEAGDDIERLRAWFEREMGQ